MKKLMVILMLGLVATGCAQKKVVKVDKPSHVMPVEEKKAEAPPKTEEIQMTPVEQEVAKVESEEVKEKYVEKEAELRDDIFFDYDRYEIRSDAVPVLNALSAWLLKNPYGVLIEGHCDERGTNEYNLALGDRRAASAKDFLISSGVPKKKIVTISYGEERPACVDQTEECWGRNRRAHFVYIERETNEGNL